MLPTKLSLHKEGEVSSPLLIIIHKLLGKAQNKGHSLESKATALFVPVYESGHADEPL